MKRDKDDILQILPMYSYYWEYVLEHLFEFFNVKKGWKKPNLDFLIFSNMFYGQEIEKTTFVS